MLYEVITNVDDPYGRRLKAMRPDLLSFGLDSGDAELRGTILDSGTWGMELEFRNGEMCFSLKTALAGRHNASNLLRITSYNVCYTKLLRRKWRPFFTSSTRPMLASMAFHQRRPKRAVRGWSWSLQ